MTSGKNKGKPCGKKGFESCGYCRIHRDKHVKFGIVIPPIEEEKEVEIILN